MVPSGLVTIEEIPRAAAESLVVASASSSAVFSAFAPVQLKPSRLILAQSTGYFLVELVRKNDVVAGATGMFLTTPVMSDLKGPVGRASS